MNNKPTKGRVLVVEENPRMLTFLRFLLDSEGYDVIGAPDSRLARGVLESPPGPVGLIILDVVDGFALLQRIRLEGNEVPIIFVSAVAAAKAKARVLWVGAPNPQIRRAALIAFQPHDGRKRASAVSPIG